MSTIAAPGLKTRGAQGINPHRVLIVLGIAAAALLCVGIFIYGADYYTLGAAKRALSPKQAQLRPSGTIGYSLGVLGGALFALVYLYPLRKHWPWLMQIGKTRHWLNYHVLLGLSAPVIITLHSSFKFHGVAGMAYWTMALVVASGVVGRYFYSRIPRRLDHAEMSLDEMRETASGLAAQLREQHAFSAAELAPLFDLPRMEEVQSMPLPLALGLMVKLDLRRYRWLWSIRRHAAAADVGEALVLVKKQAALTKDILFLSKMKQLFHLWHIIHRPFSYSFAVLAILHIAFVLLLGYY